jgi:hypothetical protein
MSAGHWSVEFPDGLWLVEDGGQWYDRFGRPFDLVRLGPDRRVVLEYSAAVEDMKRVQTAESLKRCDELLPAALAAVGDLKV